MPDEPIIYGDDCLACFDAGETPKYLYVRFSGIVQCPAGPSIPPNDRVFKLTQNAEAACYYRYDSADWGIGVDLNAAPNPTDILLMSGDELWSYFSRQDPDKIEEGKVYSNDYVGCPAWRGGKDGICVITWSPQATEVLASINMAKGNNLFMELFPKADGKLVYKFCRLQDATNVAILYEP